MRKLAVILAVTLLAIPLATFAISADEKPAAENKTSAAQTKKPSVKKERTTLITATVEAIDLDKRIVTVKGPKGNLVDITAGEQVKNLPQVKVGDSVNIAYYESIAVKVFKPGELAKENSVAVGAERLAKPGEKPSGIVGAQATITATVESISPKKTSVTLKLADGKYKVVKVADKRNLKNVKAGDEVAITLTETLAISVTPAKK